MLGSHEGYILKQWARVQEYCSVYNPLWYRYSGVYVPYMAIVEMIGQICGDQSSFTSDLGYWVVGMRK